jgi:ADP-heptose:LPS heptosyltransferase
MPAAPSLDAHSNPLVLEESLWAQRISRAERMPGSEHVWREAGGSVIKVFRPGSSEARARSFLRSAAHLADQKISAPVCREFLRRDSRDEFAVVYDYLPGVSLRELAATEGRAALAGFMKFLAALHARGIYFRGAHLGNVLSNAGPEFSLIDVASLRCKTQALRPGERARNLVHIFGNGTDQAFWTPARVERSLNEYLSCAGLKASAAQRLRWRLQFGLRGRRRRVDLHDKVPVGPKIQESAERLIVILPERLGDVVMALTAFGFLASRRPRCEFIAVAPTAAAAELGRRQCSFSTVLESPAPRALRELGRRSELVLDLHGNDRTEFFARAAQAPVLTARRRGEASAPRHQVEWLVHSLAEFLDTLPGAPPSFAFGLRDADRARAGQLLAARGFNLDDPFVLVHLGVGRYVRRGDDGRGSRSRRRWPVARFAAVAQELAAADPKLHFILTGMGPERALDAEFAASVPRSIRLQGEADLGALAALSMAARLVLCADTGPMHLAAALNEALVAVFLDTDPLATGPFPRRAAHGLMKGEQGEGPSISAVAEAARRSLTSFPVPRGRILEIDGR